MSNVVLFILIGIIAALVVAVIILIRSNANLKDEAKQAVSQARSDVDLARAGAEREIASARTAAREEIDRERRASQSVIDNTRAAAQADIETAHKSYETEKAQLIARQAEEIAAIRNDCEERIKHLKEDIEADKDVLSQKSEKALLADVMIALNGYGARFERIEKRLVDDQISSHISNLFENVSQKIGNIDTELTKQIQDMNGSIQETLNNSSLEQQFENTNRYISLLGSGMVDIKKDIENLGNAIEETKSMVNIDSIESKISDLQSNINDLQSNVEEIKSDVSSIYYGNDYANQQSSVSSGIDDISSSLNSLSSDVSSISSEISSLSSEISSLSSSVSDAVSAAESARDAVSSLQYSI